MQSFQVFCINACESDFDFTKYVTPGNLVMVFEIDGFDKIECWAIPKDKADDNDKETQPRVMRDVDILFLMFLCVHLYLCRAVIFNHFHLLAHIN